MSDSPSFVEQRVCVRCRSVYPYGKKLGKEWGDGLVCEVLDVVDLYCVIT